MELLDGSLAECGPLPEHVLRPVTHMLILGLRTLHECVGLAHNDVKPSNLLYCTRTGCVKIADYGSCDTGISAAPNDAGSYWYYGPEGFQLLSGSNPNATSSSATVMGDQAASTAASATAARLVVEGTVAAAAAAAEDGAKREIGGGDAFASRDALSESYKKMLSIRVGHDGSSEDALRSIVIAPPSSVHQPLVVGTARPAGEAGTSSQAPAAPSPPPPAIAPRGGWATAGRPGQARDVWATGITILSLLLGRLPFKGAEKLESNEEAYWHARRCVLEDPLYLPQVIADLLASDAISATLADFLKQCLTPSPELRPLCRELLQCAWLRELPPHSVQHETTQPQRDHTAQSQPGTARPGTATRKCPMCRLQELGVSPSIGPLQRGMASVTVLQCNDPRARPPPTVAAVGVPFADAFTSPLMGAHPTPVTQTVAPAISASSHASGDPPTPSVGGGIAAHSSASDQLHAVVPRAVLVTSALYHVDPRLLQRAASGSLRPGGDYGGHRAYLPDTSDDDPLGEDDITTPTLSELDAAEEAGVLSDDNDVGPGTAMPRGLLRRGPDREQITRTESRATAERARPCPSSSSSSSSDSGWSANDSESTSSSSSAADAASAHDSESSYESTASGRLLRRRVLALRRYKLRVRVAARRVQRRWRHHSATAVAGGGTGGAAAPDAMWMSGPATALIFGRRRTTMVARAKAQASAVGPQRPVVVTLMSQMGEELRRPMCPEHELDLEPGSRAVRQFLQALPNSNSTPPPHSAVQTG
jgi:serine/threonine protein kinase